MTEEQPKEVPQPETQTPAQDAQGGDKKERGRGNKRGFGRGGRGQKRGPRGQEEEEWIPCTNLGRLVKSEYVKSLEEIYFQSKNGKSSISYTRNPPMLLRRNA